MNGNERREAILEILKTADKAVSAREFAERFNVSRQVIVQDIALLRANGADITSGRLGYQLSKSAPAASRVFKVYHSDEDVEKELDLIVDYGGTVQDVFVYHKVYGVIRAELNIRSRLDTRRLMDDIHAGTSSLLMNITSGYHYHTVLAESEQALDLIQQVLDENHFLAPLREYEPVDFKKED